MTAFNYRVGAAANLTAAQVDANFAALAVGSKEFYIPTVANQDYTVCVKMTHGGTINETTVQAVSGACTVQFKVNAVALGAANAASTAINSVTQATTNTFLAGDKVVMTCSANASCLGLAAAFKYSRTLD